METNITIPSNTETYNPIIASTASSIVAIYRFDLSGIAKVCFARSTNGGSSFYLSSTANSNLNNSLNTFISDSISEYYVGDINLFASSDIGITFKQIQYKEGHYYATDYYSSCLRIPQFLR